MPCFVCVIKSKSLKGNVDAMEKEQKKKRRRTGTAGSEM